MRTRLPACSVIGSLTDATWVAIRPHDANEVYVTGTFDDWGKTIRLDKKGDFFEKEVQLSPPEDKLHYKVRLKARWGGLAGEARLRHRQPIGPATMGWSWGFSHRTRILLP